MELDLLLRGVVIGFSIAAPVGPIGVLCIRRTLDEGQLAGLLSGLGAATADALYGCVAGLGLSFISSFMIDQRDWLQTLGGLFLCYLGIRTLVLARASAPPAPESGRAKQRSGLLAAYLSTFFLTLTNPITILSFAAVFAGMGLGKQGGDLGAAGLLVLGVFAGSAAWWLLLSGGAGLLRDRFSPTLMVWVNRLSGLVILGFGLLTLGDLLRSSLP